MGKDRITELRIEGLRTIERLKLPLRGLTVLIGENGSGKSSILEACEILRRAAGSDFFSELYRVHGGMFSLLRHGAAELKLGVTVEGSGARLHYDIILAPEGSGAVIVDERLEAEPASGKTPVSLIERTREGARFAGMKVASEETRMSVQPDKLFLPFIAGPLAPYAEFGVMQQALAEIQTYLPFEVLPVWASRAYKRRSAMRTTMLLEGAERVENLGENLANVFHTLKTEFGEDHWRMTMDYVRLGLGDHIDSINTRADAGGGAIALWMKLKNRDRQIPASALADGELAYLAFVALYRLPGARSLLTFDEPELHLHPGLLVRVLSFFESIAEEHSVLLATHSDRLLDAIQDPAQAVRVCEVEGEDRKTRIRTLDPDALKEWRATYSGLGHIRSEGYLDMVLREEASA